MVRTGCSAIIAELEARVRGPYAGTMGVIAPDGRASFNILIRTLRVPRGAAFGLTDVGSGIVSDSTPEGEWRECHSKLAYLADQYRQAGVHS